MTRELLFHWSAATLEVLVPKRRGEGYLKVPFGHHEDAGLARIERVAGCDIWGLDGSLSFQCGTGVATYETARAEFTTRVMPALAAHYAMGFREAGAVEFWDLHPNGPPKGLSDRQR
jgi:hypothetical protein